MMRKFAIAAMAVLALGVTACDRTANEKKKAEEASIALKTVMDDIVVASFKESPEFATQLGVSEDQAGGKFQDRLSDASAEGLARQAGLAQGFADRLSKIDAKRLSIEDKVSYDVVATALRYSIAGNQFGYGNFGINGAPTPYVVNQMSGAYAGIPDFLDSQHPMKSVQDIEDYLKRVEGFATMLDQETARIGADAEKGVIPPAFIIDKTVTQLTRVANMPAPTTVLVQSVQRRAPQVEGVTPVQSAEFVRRAITLTKDNVQPALRRQIEALNGLRAKAGEDAGVWKLPNGAAYYKSALAAWTTTDMSADEIHQMGLDLVASYTTEMDTLLKSMGRVEGTVGARMQALSKEPAQLYPNTQAGKAQVLSDLNAQMAEVSALLPQYFGRLPKAPLEIKRVPPDIELGAPGGYYQAPALDGSRPGFYYINLRNTNEWPRFTLPTLTYHEGSPGHHLQIAIAQENKDTHILRSSVLWFSGYGEGWALYAEQLADEMGLYKDKPEARLGYLQSMIFRAARLVVDTGLHHKKWTRQQAIDYMVTVTGDQPSGIETEIDRYIVWPGQACAYMPGRVIIDRLRTEAKTALGERFDIKAFHDQLLIHGAMPLSTLEGHIRAWVATQQNAKKE